MTQPNLPDAAAQQQAAVEVFAQYEPPLYEAYLEMMLEWLAAVKVAVFAGGIARLALMPDPMTVFSQTPKWDALTDRYTEQVARDVLAAPYKDLFADGTLFESRPFVRNWIAARANRLQAVPDEVFGAVAHIIDAATTNGASIPDVQDQIEQLFGDTSTAKWKGRARTVARTEVVGAYNGGLHDAFSMIVAADPDTAWVKRWLATEDSRTRPDHVEADGQTVPFGQPFTVGGFQMMHPHDPDAPAKEVVNCRCVELLEIENEPTEMGNRQYKDALTAGFNPAEKRGEHGKWTKGSGLLKSLLKRGKDDEKEHAPKDPEFSKRHLAAFDGTGKTLSSHPSGEAMPEGDIRTALRGYTTGGTDKRLNAALRSGKMTPADEKEADTLDKAMKPTTGPTLTYRGVEDPKKIFGSDWKPSGDNSGLEWQDKGYVSTSQGEEAAMNHTNGSNIVMHIVAPKGTKAVRGFDDQTGYDGEQEHELLLQRGLRFRIVEDHKPVKAGQKIDFNSPYDPNVRTLVIEALPPKASVTASGITDGGYRSALTAGFNPAEKRGEHGKWTKGGGLLKSLIKAKGDGAKTGPEALDALPSIGDKPESQRKTLSTYSGKAYAGLNATLLHDLKPSSEEAKLIAEMDAALAGTPREHDVVVWRGMSAPRNGKGFNPPWNGKDLTGVQWTQGSYTSTSADPAVAEKFVGPNGGIVMRVVIPKHAKVGAVDMRGEANKNTHEAEALLSRGARFRVVADHGIDKKTGKRRVDVEVIS